MLPFEKKGNFLDKGLTKIIILDPNYNQMFYKKGENTGKRKPS
jgi:hypothetical protein